MAGDLDHTGIADAIRTHGWTQGSILASQLAEQVFHDYFGHLGDEPPDIYVVVSHDCDVGNPSLEKEPVIEILAGRLRARRDSRLLNTKNPRKLHLPHGDATNEQQHIEFRVDERRFVPRAILADEAPAMQSITGEELATLTRWLAGRYVRSSFPYAFDDRLRPILGNLRQLLENHPVSAELIGVYFRVRPFSELEPGQPYTLDVKVSMDRHAYLVPRFNASAAEVVGDIEILLDDLDDIELGDVDLVSSDQVTLSDLMEYQRFTVDYLSFQAEEAILPPIDR